MQEYKNTKQTQFGQARGLAPTPNFELRSPNFLQNEPNSTILQSAISNLKFQNEPNFPHFYINFEDSIFQLSIVHCQFRRFTAENEPNYPTPPIYNLKLQNEPNFKTPKIYNL